MGQRLWNQERYGAQLSTASFRRIADRALQLQHDLTTTTGSLIQEFGNVQGELNRLEGLGQVLTNQIWAVRVAYVNALGKMLGSPNEGCHSYMNHRVSQEILKGR